jgi:DNA repair protein RecN (Recombination protein N)
MLVQLVIRDFALIEKVELMLGTGLNVLTGETGAGKSIIVDAMNLLVGGRASSDLVRNGAEKALVQGYFDCRSCRQVVEKAAELGLPLSEDQMLLLTREVSRGGRSACRVDGQAVPLAVYRPFGELLVDLHGQHEHQSLLRVGQQRELLDRYCGAAVLQQRSLVSKIYRKMTLLRDEYGKEQLSGEEARRRLDYLQYAAAEIDRVQPTPGEEEELQQKRERLRYAEKLASLAQGAFAELTGNDGKIVPAYDLLSSVTEKLREIAQIDGAAEEMAQSMDGILFGLEDLIGKLRSYQEGLDFDQDYAEEVEERLFSLRDLMRKYGASLAEVCDYRLQAAAEMEKLQGRTEHKEMLGKEYEKTLQEYNSEAEQLSSLRREGAASLSRSLAAELHGLGLENARLEIGFTRAAAPSAAGYDLPEFLFSANPGAPLKPLARIASGGEMSRVMLALKVVLAENDQIPTLIFDEIDAGIGGLTLQAVAERLAALGMEKQVLCVTHAPHIAGRGRTHFYVEKSVSRGKTEIHVSLLDPGQRVDEVVRMLGGAADEEAARNHALQILKNGGDQ